MQRIVDRLIENHDLPSEEMLILLQGILKPENKSEKQKLHDAANMLRERVFGNSIFKRGLIEISNRCKNDCYYCGIRRSNSSLERYRMSKDEILEACKLGNSLGFRTFVLQSGEDSHFTEELLEEIIVSIKGLYPNCAITLSLGENGPDFYQKCFDAGADRYLLRHEAADESLYKSVHPQNQTINNRKKCLESLAKIGYQVGTGFMVGLPGQTAANLVADLEFIKEINPAMVGIGPFISHKNTPFGDAKNGDVEMTLVLISIIRLLLPSALIPSTTALGTVAEKGREMGILAGANVVMPNLTPMKYRKLYALYDNKISTGEETAEGVEMLAENLKKIGCELVDDKGDYKNIMVN